MYDCVTHIHIEKLKYKPYFRLKCCSDVDSFWQYNHPKSTNWNWIYSLSSSHWNFLFLFLHRKKIQILVQMTNYGFLLQVAAKFLMLSIANFQTSKGSEIIQSKASSVSRKKNRLIISTALQLRTTPILYQVLRYESREWICICVSLYRDELVNGICGHVEENMGDDAVNKESIRWVCWATDEREKFVRMYSAKQL